MRVPFPVVLANVLVLVTVLGLSYMWLCARCDALGGQIKELEVELIAAQKRTNAEQERWAKMTNPPNLREAIRIFGLNMTMPRDAQIVKVGRRNGGERTAMLDQ